MSAEPITWTLLLLLGTITGVVAGVFGMGAGLLIVPALTLWDIPVVEAAATSLIAVFLSAVSGSVQNWWTQQLNLRVSLQLALFGIPTAWLGAALAERIPDAWLAGSFAALLLVTIYLMNLKQKAVLEPSTEPLNSITPALLPIARIGLLAGVVSGLFGIGGGCVMVPLQMILLAEPIKGAVRTSLGAMIAIALSGLCQHAWSGDVLWIPGLCLGVGGIIGGQVGSRLLPHLPETVINLLFKILLIVLALYMVGIAF